MPAHQRPAAFMRAWHGIRDWWHSTRFYAVWSEDNRDEESYESGAGFPQAAPTSRLELPPASEQQPPASAPQPAPEKPLVYLPAPPQDVLRNIAHDVMDMLGRDVSPYDVLERMTLHMAELKKRHLQLRNLERRSQTNVDETQMDASLLAAADRRGESPEELEERAARVLADMLARAKRASDPAPTGVGVIPRITEDMPDPRVTEPEPTPLPSEPFLTAAGMSAPVAVANGAMALRTPVAPVEVEPESNESLSAICDVDAEKASAGQQVSA